MSGHTPEEVIAAHQARELALCEMLADYHRWKSEADKRCAALGDRNAELLEALAWAVEQLSELNFTDDTPGAFDARAVLTKGSAP